jgi:hypothetical protein
MRPIRRLPFPPFVLLALALAACGGGQATDEDDAFRCATEKCDQLGPLSVSRRWVPADGFLRVSLAADHTLAVAPQTGVKIEGGDGRFTLTFSQKGYYSIQAQKGGQQVAELKVRVADDSPVFTVDSPAPGAFVPQAGRVALAGKVVDPLGAPVRVKVGDTELPVGSDGAFRGQLQPIFGVNYVEILALDAAGNVFRYSHSFVAAPRFGRAESLVNVGVSEELLDLLAAKLSPLLPSIIQLPARPDPIADPLAHRIFFDGATLPGQDDNPGSIAISLDSHAGSVHATTRATGDLIARAHVDNWVLSDTHITATARDLSFDATVAFPRGADPRVTDLAIDFSSFDLQSGSIVGWLAGLFVEATKGILGDVIKGHVGPILGDVLGAVQGDYRLDLVLGCLELHTPFTLGYRLDEIDPAEGRLGVRLGAQARSDGAQGPGAPARDEQPQAAPASGPMAVGVGYNLLNQFLYEVWKAGALEIKLDERDLADALPRIPGLAGLDVVLNVKAELGMPPVVEPGANGQILFSFGELRLDIMLDVGVFQVSIAANVGARTDVALAIEDGAVRVTPTVRELHLDLGRRAFSGLNPEAVEALVRAMAPELVTRIAGSLEAFRLPQFDLDGAGLPGVRLGIDSGKVTAGAQGATFAGRVSVLTDTPAPTTGPGCRTH